MQSSSAADTGDRGALSPRFLVVGYDARRAAELRNDLARLGGQVRLSKPEDLGKPLPDPRAPHIIILDLVNCQVDADDLWRDIRSAPGLSGVPVLAIVNEDNLAIVNSLPGLDDFLVAPYRQSEFAARLRRVLKRVNGALSAQAITVGNLVLDPESYEVRLNGVRVDLTLKEYELLKHLLTNPGRVFTRGQLLNGIWGYEYLGGTRTVDVHIRRLRAKLGQFGEGSIETVRGVGYAFRP